MEMSIREIGLMEKRMEKEHTITIMVQSFKDLSIMARRKASE